MPTPPLEKPRLSGTEPRARIAPYAIDRSKYPLVVVGIRGYYRDSMGAPRVNDRGIYDDAIFIDTDQATVAYNGTPIHQPTGRVAERVPPKAWHR